MVLLVFPSISFCGNYMTLIHANVSMSLSDKGQWTVKRVGNIQECIYWENPTLLLPYEVFSARDLQSSRKSTLPMKAFFSHSVIKFNFSFSPLNCVAC